MFEVTDLTEAHLATVTNRIERHGDEDKPAVSLGIEIETANTILDRIDPRLREALYKALDESQEELPDIERTTPVLRCNSIDRVALPTKHEGWTLAVDDNIDESNPMRLGSVKVDKFSVEPKQGGTVILRFRAGTSDVDAERLGKLAMHAGQSIWIRLTPPPKPADDAGDAAPQGKPPASAGDLFTAVAGSEKAAGEGSGEALPEGWPFPRSGGKAAPAGAPPQSVTVEQSQPGTRTARGRDKTKKALAAGAAS